MEKLYTFEPSSMEIFLTELFGMTVMRSYYSSLVSSLEIQPTDKVLDYCSGSGIISKRIARLLKKGQLVYTDVSKLWLKHAGNRMKHYSNIEGRFIDKFEGIISGGGYDRIVVHYSLHDFPEKYRRNIINQLVNNLKQDGILTIREPLSTKHGFELFEIINLMESCRGMSYEYKVVRRSIAGQYIDLKCKKDDIGDTFNF